ncbi:MAG: hypothetical protein F6J93_26755 [Oscillatoria sp. SIO1A7]|nr:hypothetical protein [Oscillatoria sp. SIO1A7]
MRLEIPPFDENGNLPPGVHWADWSDFKERFGTTYRRNVLILGLEAVMKHLKAAGCRTIYINGSFVTQEPKPNDFDACWDREDDVDIDYLRTNAPIVLNFYNPSAQKAKYGGEIYPSYQPAYGATMTIDFFQRDRFQNPKGIVAIDLLTWEP